MKSLNASLAEDEIKLYGNRCPDGYQKLEVLGKGGCAVVWLGQNLKTHKKVALK